MALNIKNPEVEQLASEVATLAHESKTEAIRRALIERRSRLQARGSKPARDKKLRQFLERTVWPVMPKTELGRVIKREEEDEILGYGPQGY